MAEQWEYRVASFNQATAPEVTDNNIGAPTIDRMLNDLGVGGWELVSVLPREAGDANPNAAVFHFKRSKPG
jgi:hypothetical protein